MGRHSDDSDGAIFRSRWAFFALQSIANVYRHLNTEHHALVTTVVNATLDVFSLEDFWHKDADQNTIFHNFLSSLSIIFAGLSTALPPLGATAGATSGLVGGANALYERAVKSSPDDLSLSRAQADYGKLLQRVWTEFSEQLRALFNELIQGNSTSLSIVEMIKKGAWAINPNSIQNLTEISSTGSKVPLHESILEYPTQGQDVGDILAPGRCPTR